MRAKIQFTSKQIENIIKEFKNGNFLYNIGKIHNVSAPTIKRVLLENNVDMNFKEAKANQFLTTPSKELLYFWGFILGDGSLTKQNYLVITIDQKDRSILEQFCKWFDYPLNRIKKYARKRKNGEINIELQLSICNKLLPIYLDKYGIVPNKTYNPKIPTLTQQELSSFIIGLLDADGHIKYDEIRYSGKYLRKDNVISIVGNEIIVQWVMECYRQLGFNKTIYYNKANNIGLSKRASIFNKKDIIQLAKILDIENNYSFCLKRKWHNLYQALI
jgi:hypothetical protein